MSKPVVITEEQLDQAKKLMDPHKLDREYRRGLIVRLMADNRYTAEELALILGISVRTIFDELARIRKPKEQQGTWGGRRHSLMTFEQEESFLDKFFEKAKEGTILTVNELHAEFNNESGTKAAKTTIYNLLSRHSWRKVKPDTRHPKCKLELQDEFKKKRFRYVWKKFG
jgi:transposase